MSSNPPVPLITSPPPTAAHSYPRSAPSATTSSTGCPQARTATIVLRGGSEQFIDEAERSLHDAVMIVRCGGGGWGCGRLGGRSFWVHLGFILGSPGRVAQSSQVVFGPPTKHVRLHTRLNYIHPTVPTPQTPGAPWSTPTSSPAAAPSTWRCRGEGRTRLHRGWDCIGTGSTGTTQPHNTLQHAPTNTHHTQHPTPPPPQGAPRPRAHHPWQGAALHRVVRQGAGVHPAAALRTRWVVWLHGWVVGWVGLVGRVHPAAALRQLGGLRLVVGWCLVCGVCVGGSKGGLKSWVEFGLALSSLIPLCRSWIAIDATRHTLTHRHGARPSRLRPLSVLSLPPPPRLSLPLCCITYAPPSPTPSPQGRMPPNPRTS